MTASKIRIVVFDLGRVMIRLSAGWEGACQAAGISYRPFDFTPEERAAFVHLEREYECGRLTTDHFAEQVHQHLHGLYTPDEFKAIYLAIIQEEFPGIHDIVLALKGAGYTTACLSNTSQLHWPLLTDPVIYPGIAALDIQHASFLFGLAKPDPVIYRRFEEVTGFSSKEIIFFDDREDNIEGAQSCGWHAMQITPDRLSVEQITAALKSYGVEL
ncbi:MAG: HAD-IA family hydrolase [Armatimonadota bacterium]